MLMPLCYTCPWRISNGRTYWNRLFTVALVLLLSIFSAPDALAFQTCPGGGGGNCRGRDHWSFRPKSGRGQSHPGSNERYRFGFLDVFSRHGNRFCQALSPAQKGQPNSGPNLPGLAFVVYLLTLFLAVPGGFLLTRLGLEGDPFLLAFVLSATSLGVLLPVLKERGLLQQPGGQLVFLTALLADFVTVLLLTVYIITLDRGLDPEIFSLGLLFVAFFVAYRFGLRFTRIPGVRNLVEELSQATVQLKVRGAIAILMAFVVLAELLGAELILGRLSGRYGDFTDQKPAR